MAAMRHGLYSNGESRLRPYLVMETARLWVAPEPAARRGRCGGWSCDSCYSLIHDDLPYDG